MEACIRKVCGSRKGVNVMEACVRKVCGSRKGVNVIETCVRKVCGSRKGVNVIETCIRKTMCNFNTHFSRQPPFTSGRCLVVISHIFSIRLWRCFRNRLHEIVDKESNGSNSNSRAGEDLDDAERIEKDRKDIDSNKNKVFISMNNNFKKVLEILKV
ncbi:hypothetical protein BDZ91DRAFT_769118 [Kalaharituber pfeilii]|nr:hypothetical protein BDZ91DRAFT_769118 [Kalaharituber pfeilii]